MSRRFLSLLSLIFLLNLLVKPLYILAIEVTIQNRVGAQVYGIYFALLNSAYLFQIINDFGINIYNNRRVASNTGGIAGLFKRLLQIKGVLALIFLVCLFAFAATMGYLDRADLLIPIAINLILVSFVLFLRSNISGLGLYRQDSVLSVLDKLLMILICGYLLFFSDREFTIEYFIYAQMASLVITALLALMILIVSGRLRQQGKDSHDLRQLFKESLPFAISVFLMSIYTRVDGVMIEMIADNGPYQAGAYAAGYRLLDAANMMGFLFAVLLLPMFSKLNNNREELIRLLNQASRAMLVLTVTVAVMCFFFRFDLMNWLYTQASVEWAGIFGILILSFVAIGMMYVFGTYLTAVEDVRKINIVYFVCVVLNIVLNFLLIPEHGAYGAALATLATQVAATISLVAFTYRSLQFHVTGKMLFTVTAFSTGSIFIALLTQRVFAGELWLAGFIIGTVAILGLGSLLKLVDYKELRAAISSPATPV